MPRVVISHSVAVMQIFVILFVTFSFVSYLIIQCSIITFLMSVCNKKKMSPTLSVSLDSVQHVQEN